MQNSTTLINLTGNAGGGEPESVREKLALSIAETCKMTGLGRSSIYEAIAQGKLRAKKSGARTIILPIDLSEFLAALPAANFSRHRPSAVSDQGGSGHDR